MDRSFIDDNTKQPVGRLSEAMKRRTRLHCNAIYQRPSQLPGTVKCRVLLMREKRGMRKGSFLQFVQANLGWPALQSMHGVPRLDELAKRANRCLRPHLDFCEPACSVHTRGRFLQVAARVGTIIIINTRSRMLLITDCLLVSMPYQTGFSSTSRHHCGYEKPTPPFSLVPGRWRVGGTSSKSRTPEA